MEIALQSTPFFQAVEYLAIFSCGMAGGLTAVRKRYDVSSIIIIAWITALGGGIIRDVLLGALPPVGISDMGSVLTAFAAGAVTAVVHPEVDKLKWSMITIDALALGLFAVNGTSKALLYNTSGMTAVFLGTFTAMGGGVIRDMLVNEVPMVVRDPHLYVVPAVLGSIFTVWADRGQYGDAPRCGDCACGDCAAHLLGEIQHSTAGRGATTPCASAGHAAEGREGADGHRRAASESRTGFQGCSGTPAR